MRPPHRSRSSADRPVRGPYLFDMGHQAVMNDDACAAIPWSCGWGFRRRGARVICALPPAGILSASPTLAPETEEQVGAWLDGLQGRPDAHRLPGGRRFYGRRHRQRIAKRVLRVPQDVSVMSIDGFNLAAIQEVPLTAVHVPRMSWAARRCISCSSACCARGAARLATAAWHAGGTRFGTADPAGQGHTAVEPQGLYDD